MPKPTEWRDGNYQITDYGEPVLIEGARLRFMVCDGRMRCFGYFTSAEDAELFVRAKNEQDASDDIHPIRAEPQTFKLLQLNRDS